MKLDEIDRRIIRELQRDGRLQNNELAGRGGLSPSSCLRRVRLPEEAGVISRHVAVIDQAKVGPRLSMFARVWLVARDAETITLFIAAMRRLPEVVECCIMPGESDALLRMGIGDLDGCRRFQSTRLTRRSGIRTVKADVPSEIVEQTVPLPV